MLTPQSKWVRNFTLNHVPYMDLNNTIDYKDHHKFLENEIQNSLLRIQWIDSEDIYHPNIVIVSDGFDFVNRQKILNSLPREVTIIGVNGTLAKWNNPNRNLNYYVVNNPYEQCMKHFPKRLKNFPKCITSTRTFHNFLKLYKGSRYKYYPVNESTYSSLGSKEASYQIDDYRNPICAAIGLAYRFNVENLLLFCCDDSFADYRASSIKLENGLYAYEQQEVASGLIDANLYWLHNQEYNPVRIANFSSGSKLKYVEDISEEEISNFFNL